MAQLHPLPYFLLTRGLVLTCALLLSAIVLWPPGSPIGWPCGTPVSSSPRPPSCWGPPCSVLCCWRMSCGTSEGPPRRHHRWESRKFPLPVEAARGFSLLTMV